jgi:hypothetical protein
MYVFIIRRQTYVSSYSFSIVHYFEIIKVEIEEMRAKGKMDLLY